MAKGESAGRRRPVLVIQTAFFGDAVLTTALLRRLAAEGPAHVVAAPVGAAAFEGLPGVTAHSYDKRRAPLLEGLRQMASSLRAVAPDGFHAVYCVHRSPRSLLLGLLVPAHRRLAFEGWLARVLGYEVEPYPPYSEGIHFADKMLAILGGGSVAATASDRRPWLEIHGPARESLQQRLPWLGQDPCVVISPYSAWGTKVWPRERYEDLASRILQAGLRVVVVGGAAEAQKDPFALRHERLSNLVGATSIAELSVVVAASKLLISNDSGPVHVAAAFDTPTVAFFGPTVRRWGFFPLSSHQAVLERPELSCRPCGLHGPQVCPLGHHRCMTEITVDQAWAQVRSLLGK